MVPRDIIELARPITAVVAMTIVPATIPEKAPTRPAKWTSEPSAIPSTRLNWEASATSRTNICSSISGQPFLGAGRPPFLVVGVIVGARGPTGPGGEGGGTFPAILRPSIDFLTAPCRGSCLPSGPPERKRSVSS